MSKELLDALDTLEKEKDISKETLFDAIENSLITACKNHFGKSFWEIRSYKSRDKSEYM